MRLHVVDTHRGIPQKEHPISFEDTSERRICGRTVVHAKDRGCSFPNCDAPGYFTEVQHVTPGRKPRTTFRPATHADDGPKSPSARRGGRDEVREVNGVGGGAIARPLRHRRKR